MLKFEVAFNVHYSSINSLLVPLQISSSHFLIVIQLYFYVCAFNFAGSNLPSAARKAWVLRKTINFHKTLSNDQDRMEKYRKMAASPFAFLRGSAYLFYAEVKDRISKIPDNWLRRADFRSWISGDAHLYNLGFTASHGELVFDLNDFDEACVESIFYDLIRFLVSIKLIGQSLAFDLDEKDFTQLNLIFLERYKSELLSTPPGAITLNHMNGFLRSLGKRVLRKNSSKKQMKKWCKLSESGLRFKTMPQKLVDLNSEEEGEFASGWQHYLEESAKGEVNVKKIRLLDAKKRVGSGLGSLGLLKIYALIRLEDQEVFKDFLLEIKQQRSASAYIAMSHSQLSWHQARFTNDAERVLHASRVLKSVSEPLTGVVSGSNYGSVVRRVSPWSRSVKIHDLKSEEDLENLLEFCAQALAQAHLRGASDLGRIDTFRLAVTSFLDSTISGKISEVVSQSATQVHQDYQLFLNLLNEGSLGRRFSFQNINLTPAKP